MLPATPFDGLFLAGRRWVLAHHAHSPIAAALLADMRLVAAGAVPAERVKRGKPVALHSLVPLLGVYLVVPWQPPPLFVYFAIALPRYPITTHVCPNAIPQSEVAEG